MAITDINANTFLSADTGEVDYAAITRAVNEAATKTRTTEVPAFTPVAIPTGLVGGRADVLGAMQTGLQKEYETKAAALKAQAGRAATGLEMMGAATQVYGQKLEEIKAETKKQQEVIDEKWAATSAQAAEYVQAAKDRGIESLATLDKLNKEIAEGREFAKAHDMQASVQAALGSMQNARRIAAEQYGVNSPEYRQQLGIERQTLATVNSNIIATYRKLQEDQNISYMNATNETMWKNNMYVSFQEQQHVETLRYLAQSAQDYSLQTSNLMVGLEQAKISGLENLANWFIETPAFTVDMAPYITAIGNMAMDAIAASEAEKAQQEALRMQREALATTKPKGGTSTVYGGTQKWGTYGAGTIGGTSIQPKVSQPSEGYAGSEYVGGGAPPGGTYVAGKGLIPLGSPA